MKPSNIYKLKFLVPLLLLLFLMPLEFNPLFSFNSLIYWLLSYPLIILNFIFILYLLIIFKSLKLRIILIALLLIYIPLVIYFTGLENQWWNMIDIAPSDKRDRALELRFYWSSYLITILPLFSISYWILFGKKIKNNFKN
jgi:hypothetical protein